MHPKETQGPLRTRRGRPQSAAAQFMFRTSHIAV
jgi:hypothetical protein